MHHVNVEKGLHNTTLLLVGCHVSWSSSDWSVKGFWYSQTTVLFDTCIFNADADSFENQALQLVFEEKKQVKKGKYSEGAFERRASFTPIIALCEAIFDEEAGVYFKRLPTILSKNGNRATPKQLLTLKQEH